MSQAQFQACYIGVKRMDTGQEIIGQIGLILTQLRYTRRAIEDIERNTARYSGFTFTNAFAAGSHFGEPPLFDGALKVYVVNINDLTTGGGFGGFLEGLLGGIGRLFGGFFGGLIGGTISGVALPLILDKLAQIAATIERIIDRLGIATTPPIDKKKEESSSAGWVSNLNLIKALTDLFHAASGGPQAGTPKTGAASSEDPWMKWQETLQSVYGVITGISRVIDGLIILMPIVIGTLASMVMRFEDIKIVILDLLQFVLRNVFLLRGVALVTIYDTIAGVAKLTVSILGTLEGAVSLMLSAIFDFIGAVVQGALDVLRILSADLKQTVDALLQWLVDTLGATLAFIGDLRIFRVSVYILQTLPLILPALYQLTFSKEGEPVTFPENIRKDLEKARSLAVAPPATGAGPSALPFTPFPSPDILIPQSDVDRVNKTIKDTSDKLMGLSGKLFEAPRGALRSIGQQLNEAATKGQDKFFEGEKSRIEDVKARATTLSEYIIQARDQAAKRPETGLEAIAKAYEGWLSGGGLTMVLGNITEYFLHTPVTGPQAAQTIPGQIVQQAPAEQPLATVDIQEVVIEVEPPESGGPPSSVDTSSSLFEALMQEWHELQQRGYRPGQGFPLAFT